MFAKTANICVKLTPPPKPNKASHFCQQDTQRSTHTHETMQYTTNTIVFYMFYSFPNMKSFETYYKPKLIYERPDIHGSSYIITITERWRWIKEHKRVKCLIKSKYKKRLYWCIIWFSYTNTHLYTHTHTRILMTTEGDLLLIVMYISCIKESLIRVYLSHLSKSLLGKGIIGDRYHLREETCVCLSENHDVWTRTTIADWIWVS